MRYQFHPGAPILSVNRGFFVAAESLVSAVRANDGIVGQNSIVELMRDLGRPRGDLWEVAVWEDAIAVRPDGGEIYLVYHVPNEAIVIPETIDAIRAMTGLETDAARSIAKTDASLGLQQRFLRPPGNRPASPDDGAATGRRGRGPAPQPVVRSR